MKRLSIIVVFLSILAVAPCVEAMRSLTKFSLLEGSNGKMFHCCKKNNKDIIVEEGLDQKGQWVEVSFNHLDAIYNYCICLRSYPELQEGIGHVDRLENGDETNPTILSLSSDDEKFLAEITDEFLDYRR